MRETKVARASGSVRAKSAANSACESRTCLSGSDGSLSAASISRSESETASTPLTGRNSGSPSVCKPASTQAPPLGHNRAFVVLRLDRLRLPLRRRQMVGAHQPQHAPQRRAHLAHTQPGPHLAVAFATEGRFLDRATDFGQEIIIAAASLRATAGRRLQAEGRPALLVERRPWQAPRLQYPSPPVGSS